MGQYLRHMHNPPKLVSKIAGLTTVACAWWGTWHRG